MAAEVLRLEKLNKSFGGLQALKDASLTLREGEVVLDLGFNMPNPNPNPQQGGQAQLLFKVTDRVIMSYINAKRLAMSLGQLIKRYEQQFGELPLQPGQQQRRQQ